MCLVVHVIRKAPEPEVKQKTFTALNIHERIDVFATKMTFKIQYRYKRQHTQLPTQWAILICKYSKWKIDTFMHDCNSAYLKCIWLTLGCSLLPYIQTETKLRQCYSCSLGLCSSSITSGFPVSQQHLWTSCIKTLQLISIWGKNSTTGV